MRVRLVALAIAAGLSIAPLSGLACELACRPNTSGAEVLASTHAGCHEPSGTGSTGLQHTNHHCDHAALVSRFADRVLGKAGSVPGAALSTSAQVSRSQAVLDLLLASASPPRSVPFRVSSVPAPLRI